MGIEIAVSAEQNYVSLVCSGPYSLSEFKKIYKTAVDAALKHRKCDILINGIEIIGELSISDRYDSSVYLAELVRTRAFGRIRKIAFVGKEPIIDPSRFAETVAVNRGINGKVFDNLGEARAWLDT